MRGNKNRKAGSINRRSFVGNTVRLITLGTLLMPIAEACKNKKSSKSALPETKKDQKKTTTRSSKKPRKKWSHESLVMNTKSNVMHFPTSKVYTYYDEIKPNHLQEISLATWITQLQEPVRLHKEQSGNILEMLALQHLRQGVNDEFLAAASDTISRAFTASCENSKGDNKNLTNFRLHELMLQLITLNTGIPVVEKWQAFNNKIKKPAILRKRQQWMANEINFNERVKYILDRQAEYINRLTERARKYAFT
jgi:hypothetical protein